MDKVIYKDLSHKIVGILFTVYNDLGYGYKESYYEKAVARSLKLANIKFKRQVAYKISYKNEIIGTNYLDFLVDDKIILELKKGKYFSRQNITQVQNYLKVTNKKLAILVNFTPNDVKFLRILNIR